jgi:hypothetical protein
MTVEAVGICRSIGSGWLLMHRRGGKWKLVAEPYSPLSAVVDDALRDLDERDFAFSTRRLDRPFLVQPFPETPAELAKVPNAVIHIMAPERDGADPVWGCVVRDFMGSWSRGSKRFRTPALGDVRMWVVGLPRSTRPVRFHASSWCATTGASLRLRRNSLRKPHDQTHARDAR